MHSPTHGSTTLAWLLNNYPKTAPCHFAAFHLYSKIYMQQWTASRYLTETSRSKMRITFPATPPNTSSDLLRQASSSLAAATRPNLEACQPQNPKPGGQRGHHGTPVEFRVALAAAALQQLRRALFLQRTPAMAAAPFVFPRPAAVSLVSK